MTATATTEPRMRSGQHGFDPVMNGSSGVVARVMLITPALAAEWLAKNIKNRPIRSSVVRHYARQIAEGRWRLNGDTVSFSISGSLLNGQHRLHAIIEAGQSIETLVAYGLSEDAYETIDGGVKRTAADLMALNGEVNSHVLSGACGLLWRYARGMWHSNAEPHPTSQEVLETLEDNPSVRESIIPARGCTDILRPSLGTACHYLFSQRDAELADKFFDQLASGVNLEKDEPVRFLRERLIASKMMKSGLPPREIHALVIIAWNHTVAKKRLRSLRWSNPKEFPVLA